MNLVIIKHFMQIRNSPTTAKNFIVWHVACERLENQSRAKRRVNNKFTFVRVPENTTPKQC